MSIKVTNTGLDFNELSREELNEILTERCFALSKCGDGDREGINNDIVLICKALCSKVDTRITNDVFTEELVRELSGKGNCDACTNFVVRLSATKDLRFLRLGVHNLSEEDFEFVKQFGRFDSCEGIEWVTVDNVTFYRK